MSNLNCEFDEGAKDVLTGALIILQLLMKSGSKDHRWESSVCTTKLTETYKMDCHRKSQCTRYHSESLELVLLFPILHQQYTTISCVELQSKYFSNQSRSTAYAVFAGQQWLCYRLSMSDHFGNISPVSQVDEWSTSEKSLLHSPKQDLA